MAGKKLTGMPELIEVDGSPTEALRRIQNGRRRGPSRHVRRHLVRHRSAQTEPFTSVANRLLLLRHDGSGMPGTRRKGLFGCHHGQSASHFMLSGRSPSPNAWGLHIERIRVTLNRAGGPQMWNSSINLAHLSVSIVTAFTMHVLLLMSAIEPNAGEAPTELMVVDCEQVIVAVSATSVVVMRENDSSDYCMSISINGASLGTDEMPYRIGYIRESLAYGKIDPAFIVEALPMLFASVAYDKSEYQEIQETIAKTIDGTTREFLFDCFEQIQSMMSNSTYGEFQNEFEMDNNLWICKAELESDIESAVVPKGMLSFYGPTNIGFRFEAERFTLLIPLVVPF